MRRRDHGWDHTWCIVFTWLTFLLVIIIYIILRRWKIDQCSGILGSWGWPLARHSDKISDMTAEIKTWMGEGGWGGDTYLGASFTRLLESTTERWCGSIHPWSAQLHCWPLLLENDFKSRILGFLRAIGSTLGSNRVGQGWRTRQQHTELCGTRWDKQIVNQLAQHHGVQCFTVEHLIQDTEAVAVLLCGGSTKEGRRGHLEPSAVCFHLDPSTHPSPTPRTCRHTNTHAGTYGCWWKSAAHGVHVASSFWRKRTSPLCLLFTIIHF